MKLILALVLVLIVITACSQSQDKITVEDIQKEVVAPDVISAQNGSCIIHIDGKLNACQQSFTNTIKTIRDIYKNGCTGGGTNVVKTWTNETCPEQRGYKCNIDGGLVYYKYGNQSYDDAKAQKYYTLCPKKEILIE